MIKIIGAIMIIMSGVGLAYFMCINSRFRIRDLSEFLMLINLMSGKIRFDHDSLPEIAEKFSKKDTVYCLFFENVTRLMNSTQKQPFEQIWECCVERYMDDTSLTKEDKQEFMQLGKNLGNTDKQLQLGIIAEYTQALKDKIFQLKQKNKEQSKMYMSMGILGSLLIVILLY